AGFAVAYAAGFAGAGSAVGAAGFAVAYAAGFAGAGSAVGAAGFAVAYAAGFAGAGSAVGAAGLALAHAAWFAGAAELTTTQAAGNHYDIADHPRAGSGSRKGHEGEDPSEASDEYRSDAARFRGAASAQS
ncbi:hypothetical protein, partial [Nocardia callitridis]|uniref:hypothetical protein n=1 Tax=Nocardia callitridis TaxID=648753 RepID=UPI0031EE6102